MASASTNHYEQQLYSVFKTFDVDNEEALDKSAVLQLCDTLQLEDRGAALVDTLFDRQADRVTFTQFRNGLLSVLGSEPSSQLETSANIEPDTKTQSRVSPPHSDDDSSGREVAPKFVYGSKKYGRRSRPQRAAPEESPRHRGSSESRLDSGRSRQRMRCKRSASAMESRDDSTIDDETADLDHDRRVDRDRALALCRGLNMHGVDRCLVDRIFEISSSQEITVGEFFDRLNASLTTSIAASLDGISTDDNSKIKLDVVSSDAVVEAWERAGVQRPRRLLIELGFTTGAMHTHDLERALDDELRALTTSDSPPDARSLLLLAAHTLVRMRLETAWRLLDIARAERDKLRDDLTEANRRARLLAQDVDENHARIEAELKSSLRQVETRHAEAARAAAAEAAAERERAAVAYLALEEETVRRAETEARLRTETSALRERIDKLQEQTRTAEVRAEQADRERARAAEDACAAEQRASALVECERAAAAELAERMHELRADCQRLRDRNDELCAALEASVEESRVPCTGAPSWREEVAMEAAPESLSPSTDALQVENNEKRTISSQAILKLQIIFDSIARLPSQIRDECPSCSNVRETITNLQKNVQELKEDSTFCVFIEQNVCTSLEVGLQTENSISDDVEALKKDLDDVKQRNEIEKQNLSSVIKELELSLEQMKVEYDKCEEYWNCKLEDEREMFAEEQRVGDERLSELVSKIGEYERQFAAHAPALPTIHEARALELQFTALEDEFAAYKTEKDNEMATKTEEIKQLKQKVEELERRHMEAATKGRGDRGSELEGPLRRHPHDNAVCVCACACGVGAGGAGAGGAAARGRAAASAREAGALRARAARAERAAQRLHARLAAADLLVKDLYIENCRLAHLPRLP